MKSINFILVTIFMMIITNSSLYSQCPPVNWLLTQGGYFFQEGETITCSEPGHNTQGGNNDELGIVDENPFLVKVKDYPPIRAFPIIPPSCGTIYYMAFDTDNENKPIPVRLENNVWHTIKTFRSNGIGYEFNVFPPANVDVNNEADFLLNFDGTGRDKVWDEPGWDWKDFLTTPIEKTYNFSVKLEGASYLELGTSGEYLANVEGGEGHYTFKWEKRIIYSDGSVGAWINLGEKIPSTYSDFSGCFDNDTVYVYFDEYKINIQKNETNDIELKVTVTSYNFDRSVDVISASKIITSTPPKIRLVNLIEDTDNFGSLIVDDNISNPITSGNTVQFNYNTVHSLRTNLLPYVINWNNSGKNEKHIFWTYNRTISKKYFNLTKTIIIDENTPKSVEANFYKIEPVTLQTEIDGVPAGKIYFSDPWYYYQDSNGNWVQSDEFIELNSPASIDENSVYGGVFLGEGYDPVYDVWNPPYYSIKASSTITINNKTHKLYFDYWEASNNGADATFKNANLDSTAVVFNNAGATVKAVMKGNLLSNTASAFANNNQRKIVRTADGTLHLVYESMGNVWLERSTDDGNSWEIMNNGRALSAFRGKSPSIAIDNENGNNFYVVYQAYGGDDIDARYPYLYVEYYERGHSTPTLKSSVYVYETTEETDLEPVISKERWGKLLLVFRVSEASELSDGLYYFYGNHDVTHHGASSPIEWYNEDEPVRIANTTSSSRHPSLAVKGTTSDAPFHLVWQESDTQIRYYTMVIGNRTITPSNYEIVSSGSGYTKNYNPTITVMDNNIVRVGWVGYRFVKGINKRNKTEAIGTHIYNAVQREKNTTGWSNVFYKLGSKVTTVNLNASEDDNTVFAWVESSSTKSGKYVINNSTNYRTICNGIDYVQISNGEMVEEMKASTYKLDTTPYSIETEEIEDRVAKSSTNVYSIGREGIISKSGAEFFFVMGDIVLNDKQVGFKPISGKVDTNNYFTYLESEKLEVNDKSTLSYTVLYGFVDSTEVAQVLKGDKNINFRVELVDAESNEILGIYDDVTYSEKNLYQYSNIAYRLNMAGIGQREVKLRLRIKENIGGKYTLGSLSSEEELLPKSYVKEISYEGALAIKAYSLKQNYPNPFNPTTTIEYQIAKPGRVELSVYDMLGRKVKTLVNGYKAKGRYSVKFSGEGLSSGVYIYRLRVNNYEKIRKMILLK